MKVKYKRIIDNFSDAPFIAALIVVPSCTRGCEGCQNQHLKQEEDIYEPPRDVGEAIKNNPFWEGVILGGLEPLEDRDNFKQLMEVVRFSEVSKLFIYTSFELEAIDLSLIPREVKYLYVKTGRYLKDSNSVTYKVRNFNLTLASENQFLHLLIRNDEGSWVTQPIEFCREVKKEK